MKNFTRYGIKSSSLTLYNFSLLVDFACLDDVIAGGEQLETERFIALVGYLVYLDILQWYDTLGLLVLQSKPS